VTLLQQIQTEALETHGDLAALLRRCRILAQRLNLEELKEWVTSELEGYAQNDTLPAYRKIETNLILAHFNGFAGAQLKNAQIPTTAIPEQLREPLTHVYFHEAIAEIAQMLRDNTDGIRAPWPVEAVRLIGQGDIYQGYFLMQALRVVNNSALRGILDQVQNRILNFALELEAKSPAAGEPIVKPGKGLDSDVRNIFYKTIIRGNVQNLAQGSGSVHQSQYTVSTQDLGSLSRTLAELGILSAEIKKAETAIAEDIAATGKAGPGAKIKAWLGEMALKTGKAAVDSATAAAVTEAVKQFFGG
jgi:hypothetical protein